MVGRPSEAVTTTRPNSDTNEPVLTVVSEAEIRRREIRIVPDLVPGLLSIGASVLYADPGLGKSMLAQAVEHHLAWGRPFGGWEIGEPVRCLVVDFEGDEALTQERSFGISPWGSLPSDRDEPAPGEVGYIYDMPGGSFADRFLFLRTYLEEERDAGRPYGYVRIDTLGDFFGAKPRDVDAYQHSKLLMTSVNKLATDLGIAVLLVHHTNKSGQYSGSIGIGGGGVCVMKLHRNEDNEFECWLESEKVRRGAPFKYALIQSPADGTWAFTDAITPTQAASAGSNRAVVDALTRRPMTKRELQDALYDMPRTTLRGVLDRLSRSGLIRFYRGAWEIRPDGSTAPEPARICSVCRGRLVVSEVGATTHPNCTPQDVDEDQADEHARTNGLKLLRESLDASRMRPIPRVDPKIRDLAPWTLMSELMAGEHRWEVALAPETPGTIVVLDRNGSYPSAAGSVPLAPGLLTRSGPLDERGDRAGIFLLAPFKWTDPRIGHPLGRIAERPGPWWVTTPHVAMLEKRAESLGIDPPVILDSYTNRATGGLLTAFSKAVQEARIEAKASGDQDRYVAVKRTSSQALRLLWPKGARVPVLAPGLVDLGPR
jgi:hypothetical protein